MLYKVLPIVVATAVILASTSANAGVLDSDTLRQDVYSNYDYFQDGKLNGLDYNRMCLRKRNEIVGKVFTLIIAQRLESNGRYLELNEDNATLLADITNRYRPFLDLLYAGGKNSRVGIVDQLRKYHDQELGE